VGVASSGTSRGSSGRAGSSPWNKGGRKGVRRCSALMEWSREGTGGLGYGSEWEREMRGTRLGVAGVLHCRLQGVTVASGDGAGEVFDDMAARTQSCPNALIFGVVSR